MSEDDLLELVRIEVQNGAAFHGNSFERLQGHLVIHGTHVFIVVPEVGGMILASRVESCGRGRGMG